MEKEKLRDLTDYYKDDGLTIVGLNDSQGVNTTSTIFKKGLLEYLASELKTDKFNPTVINAFSLLMNKTEHIDYFLKANLSLEEIKLSRVYSMVAALEKVMTDVHLPKSLGKVGYLYKVCAIPKKGDANIHLTTALKDSKEPIVIYSSGVNNLMREVGNNPFSISKDYKDRDKRPNYNYTLEKVNNPNTLNKVMDGIDKNFYNLLSINDRSDIFALGSYTPASLRSEDMKIFQDLILAYNERLTSLCNSYHITYINTNEIGNRYNNSKANFHINTKGQIALAETILESIYDKKINSSSEEIEFNGEFKVTDDGSHDVFDALLFDRLNLYEERKNLLGYDALRHEQVIAENKSEISVFKKVLQKTK